MSENKRDVHDTQSDPDSRDQLPPGGPSFGGGRHGLPPEDVAVDPVYPHQPHSPGYSDGDVVEAEKERWRSETNSPDKPEGSA